MKLFLTVLAVAALAAADDNALQKTLNDGNDQFTAKVFSEVVKAHPDKSVVLSAFSVMPPLAQLGLASVGESQDELLNAIGLKNENTTKDVFRMVNSRLRSVKGITLDMANRVYVRNNRELNDNFAKLSSEIFNSDVKNVDFKKNVETAKEINTWVEDQTNHRIKDLVDPSTLDDSTEAVLVNALYFKGKWKTQFRPEETKDRDFRVNKQTTIKVPTMHKQATYLYGESKELNAKLLEMYYEGEEASFLVVLPNEVDGLSALEEKLKDPAALKKATEAMYTTEVDVYLPKFKIETTTDLKEVLQKVGITKLFTSGKARLDNLLKGSSNLYVSNAIQKAFIEVNEEGAEAAAANDFAPVGASLYEDIIAIPEFRADRPFYVEIKITNAPVFPTHLQFSIPRPKLRLFSGVYIWKYINAYRKQIV